MAHFGAVRDEPVALDNSTISNARVNLPRAGRVTDPSQDQPRPHSPGRPVAPLPLPGGRREQQHHQQQQQVHDAIYLSAHPGPACTCPTHPTHSPADTQCWHLPPAQTHALPLPPAAAATAALPSPCPADLPAGTCSPRTALTHLLSRNACRRADGHRRPAANTGSFWARAPRQGCGPRGSRRRRSSSRCCAGWL